MMERGKENEEEALHWQWGWETLCMPEYRRSSWESILRSPKMTLAHDQKKTSVSGSRTFFFLEPECVFHLNYRCFSPPFPRIWLPPVAYSSPPNGSGIVFAFCSFDAHFPCHFEYSSPIRRMIHTRSQSDSKLCPRQMSRKERRGEYGSPMP